MGIRIWALCSELVKQLLLLLTRQRKKPIISFTNEQVKNARTMETRLVYLHIRILLLVVCVRMVWSVNLQIQSNQKRERDFGDIVYHSPLMLLLRPVVVKRHLKQHKCGRIWVKRLLKQHKSGMIWLYFYRGNSDDEEALKM